MTAVVMIVSVHPARTRPLGHALQRQLGIDPVQCRHDLRLRARRLVLPGPHPTPCGLHPQRDVHPHPGRVFWRVVVRRSAALAGLDSGGVDGCGDCVGVYQAQLLMKYLKRVLNYTKL
jgi:hypothetical protein